MIDYIQPIERLPVSEVPDYVSASVFGWGQISDGRFYSTYLKYTMFKFSEDAGLSNALQWVRVVTVTNAECSLTYGSQITVTMVCVEGNYNEGSCYVSVK